MKIGLVAFSFAIGKAEPNPCNQRIARAVERIYANELDQVVVVSQWEVTRALTSNGRVKVARSVELLPSGDLGSEEVMQQAGDLFLKEGITDVIVVAQPFLRLWKCRRLARQMGFNVLKRRVGWIGFYRRSLQWWTRDPFRLVLYSVLQLALGRRGR